MALESDLGRDQELNGSDVRIAVQGDGKVDVQNVSEGRARAQDSKAEADVAEPPRVRGISVGAATCAAEVVEHRASHAEQPERVPVGVDALLDVEQRTLVAALVVPGVAAQAGVASQQQLAGWGGVLKGVDRDGGKQQRALVRVTIVTNRAAQQLTVERAVSRLPVDRGGSEHGSIRRKPEAVARSGRVKPHVLRRAQARRCAAQLHVALESHREVFWTLDQVPVLDLLVTVLHDLVAEKRRGERVVGGQLPGSRKVRFNAISVLVVGDAQRVALRPAVDKTFGPAAERLRAVLSVAKLGHLYPVAVERVDAAVVPAAEARGPARVEGVERPDDRQRSALAVAELRERVVDRGPAAERARLRDPVLRGGAIRIV